MIDYRNVLLISEDYIKSESNLDFNVSGKYLMSAIKLAQDIELQSTIGTRLLEALQKKVINWIDPNTPMPLEAPDIIIPSLPYPPREPISDSIEDDKNIRYKELLDLYVQPFLLYQVLSEIVIPLSFKISNFGIMRTDDEKDYAAEYDKVMLIKKYYKDKADFFKNRLQDWVISNYSDFKELYEYKPLKDMYPNLYSASSTGLWLGGNRGKSWYCKRKK